MWSSINQAWKTAFELGWEAFSKGNIPIGAVITDEDGNIISSGRNRIFEKSIYNHKIAHAETEALFKLDISKYPNVHSYTLYACMEPCPMCFGAFVMSNLRTLRVAARDGYCGSVHYRDKDPYVASKNIQADFELGSLEIVQLVMHTYFELKRHDGKMNVVTEIFYR